MRPRRSRPRGADPARAPVPPPPPAPAPFSSLDAMLEAAATFINARRYYGNEQDQGPDNGAGAKGARARAWTRHWHACVNLTGRDNPLVERFARHRLSRMEREILMVLVLHHLSLLPCRLHTVADVLEALGLPARARLQGLRRLGDAGRLVRTGLVGYGNEEEALPDRTILVDPRLVDAVLGGDAPREEPWPVRTEEELQAYLGHWLEAVRTKVDRMEGVACGYASAGAVYGWHRKAQRLLLGLERTLRRHPAWRLAKARRRLDHDGAWAILLALACKELGHVQARERLYTGLNLARVASETETGWRARIALMSLNGPLSRDGWIRPCGGVDSLIDDSPGELEETEFELTDEGVERLGLGRRVQRRRADAFAARPPRLSLDRLALDESVCQGLRLATAHARHRHTILHDWGLEEVAPYGHGVTLLFSGPPGTGKTAAAEGLAHALGRKLLVVQYAEVQNCLVGQTEKNITRAFREATAQDAVLFWDEADAMFFDRDAAARPWEVRDVNVLLKELEEYEGVCILATNRRVSLDKALERRIAVKVDFARPDRRLRGEIWRKLLPARLPLAEDVRIERLAEADLSGGEIKNAVLNAARFAAERNAQGPVCFADFERAVALERKGAWSPGARTRIGFVPTHAIHPKTGAHTP